MAKGRNVCWGIRQSFSNGNSGFNNIECFGYVRDENGKLIIDAEQAEIVKMIYEMYLSGDSICYIAKYLNENEIATSNGKGRWSTSMVNNILDNRKYTGDVLLQKTYVKDTIRQKRANNNGEVQQYLVQDNHEAIIPLDIFMQVQEEKKRRSNIEVDSDGKRVKSSSRYNSKGLTGMIICEEYGRNYTRVTRTTKTGKEIVWRCINRVEYGKRICKHSPTVSEEKIRMMIMDALELTEYDEKIARQSAENHFILCIFKVFRHLGM